MNAEQNVAINITLDKSNKLRVEAHRVILPEAIQLCLAAIEILCKESLSHADDPKLVKALEEDMYEMINVGASSLLDKLFPEISARPDLTTDAIIKAENELMADKGETYVKAYEESAQSEKDIYEHAQINANLAKASMTPNRAKRRATKKESK